jgi:hypothetical protein
MLSTFITIVAMFTVVLVSHNFMLEAIHKDTLSPSKPRKKVTN